MTGYLTLSHNSVGVTSTWTGTGYPPSTTYTTPTTETVTVTVSVPSEMSGVVFNSAILSYTTESASGTRHVRYTNTSTEVTNANLLEKLINGDTISLTFSFRASGNSGGPGTHSAVCRWKNIAITVDYSPAGGVYDTLTVTDCGEAVYSIEKKSLAYGESCALSIIARPTLAITKVKAEIRCNTLEETLEFETERSIAASASSSFSYTMAISAAMYAEMSARVYAAQIRITFSGASTNYTTGWETIAFKFAKTRAAPVISAVSWSEGGGTSHISTYGNPIAGKTVPVISFSVALDTDADSSIGFESRTVSLGGKTYALGSNSATLDAQKESGTYTISVTDSYGQTGTASGTLTVLTYTPPKLTNLAISRYEAALTPGGATIYELSDDGVNVWLDAIINVQTTLGSGSNPWTLTVTPEGDSAITVASAQTSASATYDHDRTAITASYPVTAEKNFTVTLSDAFTTLSYVLTIPKAGGFFNIEVTGVAVGKRSAGTEEEPLFEVNYPAHFLKEVYNSDGKRIDVASDSGWTALTLSNCDNASGFAACAYRILNGIVFLRGTVNLSSALGNNNSVTLATLPSGSRPSGKMIFATGSQYQTSYLSIDTDGTVALTNQLGSGISISTSQTVSITATFPLG